MNPIIKMYYKESIGFENQSRIVYGTHLIGSEADTALKKFTSGNISQRLWQLDITNKAEKAYEDGIRIFIGDGQNVPTYTADTILPPLPYAEVEQRRRLDQQYLYYSLPFSEKFLRNKYKVNGKVVRDMDTIFLFRGDISLEPKSFSDYFYKNVEEYNYKKIISSGVIQFAILSALYGLRIIANRKSPINLDAKDGRKEYKRVNRKRFLRNATIGVLGTTLFAKTLNSTLAIQLIENGENPNRFIEDIVNITSFPDDYLNNWINTITTGRTALVKMKTDYLLQNFEKFKVGRNKSTFTYWGNGHIFHGDGVLDNESETKEAVQDMTRLLLSTLKDFTTVEKYPEYKQKILDNLTSADIVAVNHLNFFDKMDYIQNVLMAQIHASMVCENVRDIIKDL